MIAWLASSALMMSPAGAVLRTIGGFLRRIPWQVYAVLAVLLVLWLGWRWHEGQVRQADRAGYARAMGEVKTAADKIEAKARALNADTQALQRRVNETVKVNYVEKVAVADRRSALLRLRIPDDLSIRCGDADPAVAGSAERAQDAAPGANYAGMAAIPWTPLVDHAHQCDIYRAQVEGWQEWDARQKAAYEAWRKAYGQVTSRPK